MIRDFSPPFFQTNFRTDETRKIGWENIENEVRTFFFSRGINLTLKGIRYFLRKNCYYLFEKKIIFICYKREKFCRK